MKKLLVLSMLLSGCEFLTPYRVMICDSDKQCTGGSLVFWSSESCEDYITKAKEAQPDVKRFCTKADVEGRHGW